jgi:membrane associated rhomboid family serine protease
MYPYQIVHGQRLFTLLTAMFMHDPTSLLAGLFHLGGNMLYLYVFGDNIEDTFGHVGYLVFYLFSGLAASITYTLSVLYAPMLNSLTGLSMSGNLMEGLLGASGAIAGVLGAYIVLYPKARILTLIFYGWPIIVPIPAIAFLGFWFVLQWIYVFLGIASGVAYWAHIGGFVVGMILAVAFGLRRKKALEARRRL